MSSSIRRILVQFLILFIAFNSYGQTIEEASALFARKQLDSALVAAKSIIEQDTTAVNAYVLAGRVLVAKKNFDEAFVFLEKAQTFTNAPAYSKAWTFYELSQCYYSKGDYKKAKENMSACIDLNATRNSTAAAANTMLKLGFDTLYDSWTTRETSHFIFHFQDSSAIQNISNFTQRKEAAFDKINDFFQAKLPKKIDYFVWSNPTHAESIFKRKLAFTDASLCLTHTEPEHTVGHEMTHSISYCAARNAKWTRFISEGICVYFDQSTRNNIAALKNKNDTPVSIVDIWKNDSKQGEEILYPLGGELVKRLIESFGRTKFMLLLADQSYESAKKIYGTELDTIVNKIEKEIN